MYRILGSLYNSKTGNQIGYAMCNDELGTIGFMRGEDAIKLIMQQGSCIGVGPAGGQTVKEGQDPYFVFLDKAPKIRRIMYYYNPENHLVTYKEHLSHYLMIVAEHRFNKETIYCITLNGRLLYATIKAFTFLMGMLRKGQITGYNLKANSLYPYYSPINAEEAPPVYNTPVPAEVTNQVMSEEVHVLQVLTNSVYYGGAINKFMPVNKTIVTKPVANTPVVNTPVANTPVATEQQVKPPINKLEDEKIDGTVKSSATVEKSICQIPTYLRLDHLPRNIVNFIQGLKSVKYNSEYMYVVSIFGAIYKFNMYTTLVIKEYLLWIRVHNKALFSEVADYIESTELLTLKRILKHIDDTVTRGYWYLNDDGKDAVEAFVTIHYDRLLYVEESFYKSEWYLKNMVELGVHLDSTLKSREAMLETYESKSFRYSKVNTANYKKRSYMGDEEYEATDLKRHAQDIELLPLNFDANTFEYYKAICYSPCVLLTNVAERIIMEGRDYSQDLGDTVFKDTSSFILSDYYDDRYISAVYLKDGVVKHTKYDTLYPFVPVSEVDSYENIFLKHYFKFGEEGRSPIYSLHYMLFDIWVLYQTYKDYKLKDSESMLKANAFKLRAGYSVCDRLAGMLAMDMLPKRLRAAYAHVLTDLSHVDGMLDLSQNIVLSLICKHVTNNSIYTPLCVYCLLRTCGTRTRHKLSRVVEASGAMGVIVNNMAYKYLLPDLFLRSFLIYPFVYEEVNPKVGSKYATEDYMNGDSIFSSIGDIRKVEYLRETIEVSEAPEDTSMPPEEYFCEYYKKHLSSVALVVRIFAFVYMQWTSIKDIDVCDLIPLDKDIELADGTILSCSDGYITHDIDIIKKYSVFSENYDRQCKLLVAYINNEIKKYREQHS